MADIIVTNPSSHSYIPWEVQRELVGLELAVSSPPPRFQIVGPETAGAQELQKAYSKMCETHYAVCRDDMIIAAEAKSRFELHLWLREFCDADVFFFTKDSCTYNP